MRRSDGNSETTRGYLYAVVCSVCAGSVPTLCKLLLSDDGPVAVSGVGMALSGVLLLAYRPRVKPTKQSAPYLLFMGLVGAGAAYVMWATGLNETTAVNASLLANAEILFTTVIAYALLGERIERRQAAMGLLIVAGVVVVSMNFDLAKVQFLQGMEGNLLIIGATLSWGVENNVIASVVSRFGAPLLSKFRNLIGGAVLLGFLALLGLPLKLTPHGAVVLVLLGAAVAGATYFFVASLQRLGRSR
jgi:drug/metabolite transporter (DMT)-like permease